MIRGVAKELGKYIKSMKLDGSIDGVFRRAQILIDLDYYIKSIPFWRKVVTRKATAGAGKLSVGGFQQWFRLDLEKDFIEIKKQLLDEISKIL